MLHRVLIAADLHFLPSSIEAAPSVCREVPTTRERDNIDAQTHLGSRITFTGQVSAGAPHLPPTGLVPSGQRFQRGVKRWVQSIETLNVAY